MAIGSGYNTLTVHTCLIYEAVAIFVSSADVEPIPAYLIFTS
jgi:hypothetical protein